MSWDNVKGVSSASIWTDNPDMTQAYLFANGTHQVKLTIGVSLSLSGEGPTEEEVKTALTLIDFETGEELSHLKAGDQGKYLSVYQPNMPAVVKAIETSSSGTYQYEFDYYLSSDSIINANYASEKVALLLSYIDHNGNKIDYQTASGSKSQSYVAVTVYPPKKYGTSDSSSTPVIIKLKNDKPEYKISNHPNNTVIHDSSVQIYSLIIDDSYFRLISYEASSDILSIYPFYSYGDMDEMEGDSAEYKANESYFIPENKLNQGRGSYVTQLQFIYNQSKGNVFTIQITTNQEQNELIFINVWSYFYLGDASYSSNTGSASFSAFDQFGNQLEIEVTYKDSELKITNIY